MGRNRKKGKLWDVLGRLGTEMVSVPQPTGSVGGYTSSSGGRGSGSCGGSRRIKDGVFKRVPQAGARKAQRSKAPEKKAGDKRAGGGVLLRRSEPLPVGGPANDGGAEVGTFV